MNDAVEHHFSVAPGVEQTVGPHHVEVLAAGVRGNAHLPGQFADGQFAVGEEFNHSQPVRVPENAEHSGNAVEDTVINAWRGGRAHTRKLYINTY